MNRARPLPPVLYESLVRDELVTDLGRAGDVTTAALVDSHRRAEGLLLSREPGRICGMDPALSAFRLLDPELEIERNAEDGADFEVGPGDGPWRLATLRGSAAALLSAERTALNLLAHLSGVATATRDLVRRLEGTAARIACTRKTTPGLRRLEKYAVRIGGGRNHRFGLDDGILIKDNHLRLAGGVGPALERVRSVAGHMVAVEMEVDDLKQLEEALEAGVTMVLLDNMSPAELVRAVEINAGRALLETSGGVTAETVAEVAATGVDLISVGWITHSAPALDVALDLV